MTKGERDELSKLLKARARLAGRVAEQRAATLLAEAEAQLAKEYTFDNTAWSALTSEAAKVVKAADAEIGKRCRSLGIPEEFRPQLTVSWYSRGENASKERRAELRKIAQTRIAAMAAAARIEIETKALDGLTLLAQGALESAEARAFLAEMPTVESLMPAFDVSVLGPMRALAPKDEDPEEDPD